jgi:hypothetical protein
VSRIQTAYYGADPTTQFQWATAGSDQFSRTHDLYYMSQALEFHDHSNGRGLPVARMGTGTITSTMLAAQAVDTAALANLGVTGAKLAAGAVSRDKIATPLVEATNNGAGGLQLQESSLTYIGYWWMSANGINVFAVNPAIPRIMIDQASRVCIGSQYPATPALFGIFQTGTSVNDGLRLTSPLGDSHRMSMYMDGGPQFHFQTPTADFIIAANQNALYPGGDNVQTLGQPTLRFSTFHTVNAVVYGTLSVTTVAMASLSGISVTLSGALACASCNSTTVNTGNVVASGSVGSASLSTGPINCTTISCTAISASSLSATGNIAGANLSAVVGNLTVNNADITSIARIAGGGNTHNLTIGVDSAGKPGSSTWAIVSDSRAKYASKFRRFTEGLDVLRKMEPEYYTYNGRFGTPKGMEFIGIRAEHLQDSAPHMVHRTGTERFNPDVEGDGDEILTVDFHNLFFILVNACKELADRVESLEKERRN